MEGTEDNSWQGRLRQEFDELDIRTEKLKRFIQTQDFIVMPQEDRILMADQLSVMVKYRVILAERLQRLNR